LRNKNINRTHWAKQRANPHISVSGCGCCGLSLPPSPSTYTRLTIRLMLLLLIRPPPFLPALQGFRGHELRFLARIKMAQHFTRHYALHPCVYLCVSLFVCVCECLFVWNGFTLWRIPWFLSVSVHVVNAPCLSGWLARFKLILSGDRLHPHKNTRLPLCICVRGAGCIYVCWAGALCFDNTPNCRPSLSQSSLHAISGLFACLPLGTVSSSERQDGF